MILATSITTFWSSDSESCPTSCTISDRSFSCCRMSRAVSRSDENSESSVSKKGPSTRMYLEYEMFQLTDGKCLRCASFLSRPQNTCTMPSVAEVTGSEKSPPGGDTAPTTVTEPSRSGLPRQRARPARS